MFFSIRTSLSLLTLCAAGLLVPDSASAQDAPPQTPPVPPSAAPAPEPAPAVPAQPEAVAQGQISARSVPVGNQAVLSYRIVSDGNKGIETYPQQIEVSGLQITFRQVMRRMMNVNGRISNILELHYLVEPQTAGEYTIPAQTLKMDGQTIATSEVTFTVPDGPAVADEMQPVAQLSLGKTEMWNGEVIPVQVTLLVHPSVQPVSQFFPQIRSDNFAVTRFDRSPGMDSQDVNGEPWRAWRMESVMTPLQAGQQTFGPAEVKAEVLMPLAGNGLRDPFGRMPSARKSLKIESNNLTLNVKELPQAGRPVDFNGPVGDFQLEVTASPTELNAGQPVIVEMRIAGTGNFDAVQAPVLENTDGWRIYSKPRVSEENRGWGTEPGRKSFTQILTPERNLTALPPLVFHFFDPATGQYVTRKSAPVSLKITGDPDKAATAGTGTGGQDFALMSSASIPLEELNDILPNALSHGSWITTAAIPAPLNPWLLHGIPAALLALILGAGAVRRIRISSAARRPAETEPRKPAVILKALALSRLSRRDFYTLVNEYLTAWPWHQRRPLPIGTPEAAELRNIIAARDRWLYGTTAEEAAVPMPADEQKSVRQTLARL